MGKVSSVIDLPSPKLYACGFCLYGWTPSARLRGAKMGRSVVATVVFDFDRTIIDDDNDRWIVTELGQKQCDDAVTDDNSNGVNDNVATVAPRAKEEGEGKPCWRRRIKESCVIYKDTIADGDAADESSWIGI
ncbi:uncharacterized protein HKW66_Vig0184670 [Vigna angularis]|uniref:Uncharacterized protein n=1 Tax=Phaseolus angularis TaxID=3914 RepID=A0A8T0KUN2_PHAAN|nr:uncharacterized protein HKW66_Vig0184670 [Vigna angularis]